jgi:chromosomal replication initiation ATPase DnaA
LINYGFEKEEYVASKVSSETEQQASETWNIFLELFKLSVSELKLNTWFKPIKPKKLNDNILTISVPSQDYYEMIVSRFGEIVNKAIVSILGKDGRINYEIDAGLSFPEAEPEAANTPKARELISPVTQEQETLSYSPRCYLNPNTHSKILLRARATNLLLRHRYQFQTSRAHNIIR